ncbi:hypothetical protein DFH28DRAFT_1084817 [Melampsora americana]|nr:hypothetical protein DFH28DRAFT_1084817 [Melampsora americana]
MGLSINNKLVFISGDNLANTEYVFRQTDIPPAIDVNNTLVGTKGAFPLNLNQGDHISNIITGSAVNSDNKAPLPSNHRATICVRDLTSKTLMIHYNFAVSVDWKGNMLMVYASEGNPDPKMVAQIVMNNPKPPSGSSLQCYQTWRCPHVGLQVSSISVNVLMTNSKSDVIFNHFLGGSERYWGAITTSVTGHGHFGCQAHRIICKHPVVLPQKQR